MVVALVQDTGDLFVQKEVESRDELSVSVESVECLLRLSCQDSLAVSQQPTIRCRLEGAPPAGHSWSRAATEAFRDRVTPQTVLTLRVIKEQEDCPYVELNFPDSNEGSINFDLSTEFDIFPSVFAFLSVSSD